MQRTRQAGVSAEYLFISNKIRAEIYGASDSQLLKLIKTMLEQHHWAVPFVRFATVKLMDGSYIVTFMRVRPVVQISLLTVRRVVDYLTCIKYMAN